jgi:drug/metabolite transporter (DMT)-like permease
MPRRLSDLAQRSLMGSALIVLETLCWSSGTVLTKYLLQSTAAKSDIFINQLFGVSVAITARSHRG